MGQFAAAYKLARPHRHRDTGLQSQLALDATVQLRLRKKSACCLEDVIGSAQFLVLSLQLLESLTFIRGQPWPLACIYFFALHPPMQGADRATYLGGNRFTRTPQ